VGGQQNVPALRKRGRPTADERRRREAEILDAALGVFLKTGYGSSTVDELAAAAQVTKRTLYAYYGDKAEIFAAMVRHLAAAVSLDAARDHDTLETLAARIVLRVHSDELVGLHQLVIAESTRFPELALVLHANGDARHVARLAEHIRAERGRAREPLAEPLFSLLLGEKHRRRLLGIDPPPTSAQAAAHADAALALLGLSRRGGLDAFRDREVVELRRGGDDRAELGGALGAGAPGAVSAVVFHRLPLLVDDDVGRIGAVDENRDGQAAGTGAGGGQRLVDDLVRGFQRAGLELQVENCGYRHGCSSLSVLVSV
jgi:TetR/AcrR family transcriptional repressor of mexJK operon